MDYRFLGRTGVRVSQLCFGTMSFGGDADEATSAAMFRRCRDAGVTFFDTADVYNAGASETILGRLIADDRDELVVATKGYFPTHRDPNGRGASRYHIVRACEASLRRLHTDRIDLYYLHRFDDATPLEEVLRGVELLVQQGKILYPAVSNYSAWQTARALGVAERNGWAPVAAIQPMYNLVKRQAEVEILPMCAGEGLGCVPYSPLAAGLLTGKYGVERAPETGRIVDSSMYSTRYGAPLNYQVADRFSAFARERGIAPATLAVAWVLSHPAVTSPIIGARDVTQLEAALAASELSVSAALRAEIDALSPTPPPATDRNEESTDHNFGRR